MAFGAGAAGAASLPAAATVLCLTSPCCLASLPRHAADGGITCPGDAAKAFGGGADFIMMGGIWAGTDEAAGTIVERDGKRFKQFYGMSSSTAMQKHAGGVAEYRSSEGKTVEVAHKGPVAAIVLDMLGGLRSACTYIGAHTIKEMPKRTTFIRVTQQLNQVFGSHDLSKKGGS